MFFFESFVRFIENYLIEMPSISEILSSKIGKHGKSKAYVASQLGVSEKTIENYMNGKRNPQPKALVKLAALLSFNLNDLSEQNVPVENGAKKGLKNDFSDFVDMTTMTMKPTFGEKEKQPVIVVPTIQELFLMIVRLEDRIKSLQDEIKNMNAR